MDDKDGPEIEKQWRLIYLRGLLMGITELIPGISGGTIAFITGIYTPLVRSIARINPILIKQIFVWARSNGAPKENAEVIKDLAFLLVLLAGMITSLYFFANLIQYLLFQHKVLLWAFLFGLILGSIYVFKLFVGKVLYTDIPIFWLGIISGLSLSIANSYDIGTGVVSILIASVLSAMAFILPGISGSYVLLLLGVYPVIINAVADLNLSILIFYGLGTVGGLMVFTRYLTVILNRYERILFVYLAALVLGSLPKMWPWQKVESYQMLSSGQSVPLQTSAVLPDTYYNFTGLDPHILFSFCLFLAGLICSVFLTRIFYKSVGTG